MDLLRNYNPLIPYSLPIFPKNRVFKAALVPKKNVMISMVGTIFFFFYSNIHRNPKVITYV